MKKYATLTALSLAIVFASAAQTGGLKGPAAKNYKPWKDPKPAKTIMVSAKKDLKGPQAKNYKAWENPGETYPLVLVERKSLKGPEAKNTRPFEKVETDSTLIAEKE